MNLDILLGAILGATGMGFLWVAALVYGPPYLDRISDEDENDGENDND